MSVTVTEGPKECDIDDSVQAGKYVSMHYTGSIDESSETGVKGFKFDSSVDRGATFDFTVGVGQVIKGWDEGLIGLCKGAKATLILPPEYGYGTQGAGGDIPGGATLKFSVEVVDFPENPNQEQDMFKVIDLNEDGVLDEAEIAAFFKKQGAGVPEGLWENEDTDKDGFISWNEFSGPKGNKDPAKAEL